MWDRTTVAVVPAAIRRQMEAMMDRVEITWDEDVVPFEGIAGSRHPLLRGKGYYAVLAAQLDVDNDVWHGLELLYIGKSFNQTLRARIRQPRPDYERIHEAVKGRSGVRLVVMLGEQTGASLKRVPQGFLDAVEACLIVRHTPPCNRIPTAPWAGRAISISNRGDHAPLKSRCLLRPAT